MSDGRIGWLSRAALADLLQRHGGVSPGSPFRSLVTAETPIGFAEPLAPAVAAVLAVVAAPTRTLQITVASGGSRAIAHRVSDGRSLVWVGQDGDDQYIVGAGQPVAAFVREFAAQIGERPPLATGQLLLDPTAVAALWVLGASGLRLDAPLPEDQAVAALATSSPGSRAPEVVDAMVGQGLLTRTDASLVPGPALADFAEVLNVTDLIEVASADSIEAMDSDRPDVARVVFVGRPGARVAVHQPPGGDGDAIRLSLLATGDVEALLLRLVGPPPEPTLDEAFAPAAARWRHDVTDLPDLLASGAGLEPLTATVGRGDQDAALLVTAELGDEGGEGGDARLWLLWSDEAVEVSGHPDDETGFEIPVDDLVLRVAAYCGLGDTRVPTTPGPPADASRAGRIVCVAESGTRIVGGAITWLGDPTGGFWLIDPDESDNDTADNGADPDPVAVSGPDIARLVVSYLPGSAPESGDAGA